MLLFIVWISDHFDAFGAELLGPCGKILLKYGILHNSKGLEDGLFLRMNSQLF
jgi:hypothetical protein